MSFFSLSEYTKIDVGWGFAPDPTGGPYSAPPADFKRAAWRQEGNGRKGREGLGGEGRQGEGRGKGECEGRGKGEVERGNKNSTLVDLDRRP